MSGGTLFSVVIPVFNEEVCLPELLRRSLEACRATGRPFELLLVDDGSRDRSIEIIREAARRNPEVRAVVLNRNYGQHAAVMAGFDYSRGEVVVTLDADLQNPPEEIPRLLAAIDQGHDVVGSVRVNRKDSLFRRAASWPINQIIQKSTGVKMHDYGCMLRAYRRNVVSAMLQCHEHSTFIPVLANSFARNTTEIEVDHTPRRGGTSKYSVARLIGLQFDLLTSMTTFPIRVFVVVGGLVTAVAGLGFGLFLLIARLVFGAQWAADGIFTLFAVQFFFIGVEFLAMGLLGEYIGRIYHDVRSRPRYFVQEVLGASVTGVPRPSAEVIEHPSGTMALGHSAHRS